MSQDANQSVTAPQLDDVNSSATDSSDHASIDTVEQDDQGKVGDANETMKSSDPALGAGTTMDKAKDRYDDINVGLGTGIKEGSPSGSGKKGTIQSSATYGCKLPKVWGRHPITRKDGPDDFPNVSVIESDDERT